MKLARRNLLAAAVVAPVARRRLDDPDRLFGVGEELPPIVASGQAERCRVCQALLLLSRRQAGNKCCGVCELDGWRRVVPAADYPGDPGDLPSDVYGTDTHAVSGSCVWVKRFGWGGGLSLPESHA